MGQPAALALGWEGIRISSTGAISYQPLTQLTMSQINEHLERVVPNHPLTNSEGEKPFLRSKVVGNSITPVPIAGLSERLCRPDRLGTSLMLDRIATIVSGLTFLQVAKQSNHFTLGGVLDEDIHMEN
jgi:hypothetical protein